ncbi:erythromycin esterase family protein [Maribacter sp.]|uniref:erythromycin esterase family protein n=1 Tax=Maribacter sp. TaxID=1897614 RepID=UPI0025BFF019|nr:erythromycin esterase family protein [Maribacter sp.]
MKSFFFFLIAVFLLPKNILAQKAISIEGQEPYSFLNSIVDNKRLVLLGEQTHGDGATFDEKVKIVKYLHENLGYNIIVLESGFYDNYTAFKNYANSKNDEASILDNEVDNIWSNTEAVQNLYNYIDERAKLKDTIRLLGFDSLEGSIFNDNFLPDLRNTFKKHKITLDEHIFNSLEKGLVLKDIENEAINKNDSIALYKKFELVTNHLNSIQNPNFHEKMIEQTFISQVSDVSFEIKKQQKQKIFVQNPRDAQIANNLIFLADMYANEKIICWGASYHFGKNINKIKFTDLSETYLKTQDSLNVANGEPSDYIKGQGYKLLEGGVPMGEILKEHFKDEMYSIAFSSYDGEWGVAGEKPYPFLAPPENSIEKELTTLNLEKAFIELTNIEPKYYYCSALGNLPLEANWEAIFDGLVFIKTSYPPEIREYGKPSYLKNLKTPLFVKGKVLDLANDEGIPNAEISLLNTNKIVLSNKRGRFKIHIPKEGLKGKIVVSAMGYENDTIENFNLEKLKENYIRLKEKNYNIINLDEVTVSGKARQFTAEEIIIKAQEKLITNYFQKPYNQQFYFRRLSSENSEVIKGEEAIIDTYNSNGMKGSNTPDRKMFGVSKQQQAIGVDKMVDSYWDKFGDMVFAFNRGVILSKANILYRTSSFELLKKNIVNYDGRKVYKINFVNKNPGGFSTSYGGVKSSSGIIYIDTESFAILKYDHCVIQKPFDLKKNKDKTVERSFNVVFTYKKTGDFYYIFHSHITEKTTSTSKSDPNIAQNIYFTTTDLLSTEINSLNVSRIKQPLYTMSRPKNDDANKLFWMKNNFILNEKKIELPQCN